jgi:hypothetical protein
MTVLCAVGAYFAASLCLTGGKLIIAAAFIIVGCVAELSPAYRRFRITEFFAFSLSVLSLWALGNAIS